MLGKLCDVENFVISLSHFDDFFFTYPSFS